MCNKKKPHKHAAVIKAWADGAEIQFFSPALERWCDCAGNTPQWHGDTQYRIKPEPTDFDKYGVEAGDIWESAKVELHSMQRKHRMFEGAWLTTEGSLVDQAELKVLVFRRGVVNKLVEV